MGPPRRPSPLSGSQSSLASETGTSSADPQGTSPWPDPKSPGEYQAAPSNAPTSPFSASPWSSTQTTVLGDVRNSLFIERCAGHGGIRSEPDPSPACSEPTRATWEHHAVGSGSVRDLGSAPSLLQERSSSWTWHLWARSRGHAAHAFISWQLTPHHPAQ